MSKPVENIYTLNNLVDFSELKHEHVTKTFVVNNINVFEKNGNRYSFTTTILRYHDILKNFRVVSNPPNIVNATIEYNGNSNKGTFNKETVLHCSACYNEVRVRFSFSSRDVKEITLSYDGYNVNQSLRTKLITNTILTDESKYKGGVVICMKNIRHSL